MCVHFLSELLLYDVQRIHIISFGTHALLYHTILFGEHAVEQFIIRHGPKHTDCVDNDTQVKRGVNCETMVIPRQSDLIVSVHEIQHSAIKEFTGRVMRHLLSR